MSNATKLKKKAVEHEQNKQYDKALALYVQVLDASAAGDSEPEVGLYNRVGDLLLRLGNEAEAIEYYRKAVDLYAEGGFLNNAIALCNKILRHDPAQSQVHYTLGRISAQKGFRSDAKFHFLEYAQRMQRAGEIDESFRALTEFADLCPDQDDIRLMLAEQLSKQGRSAEAVEQLQTLHEKLSADGRLVEARATAERIVAIDPDAAPRTGSVGAAHKEAGGLVFLDVSWEETAPSGALPGRGPRAVPTAPHVGHEAPPAPMIETILDAPDDAPPLDSAPLHGTLSGLEPSALDSAALDSAALDSTALELEPVVAPPALELDPQPAHNDNFGLRDFASVPEVVAPPHAEEPPASELPLIMPAPGDLAAAGAVDADAEDEEERSVGPELTFIMPDDGDEAHAAPAPALLIEPPAFVADLPRLDDPVPPAPTPAAAGNDAPADAFVNLGDWLRDSEPPKSTRMVVEAVEPGEGEEFDFDDMLRKFKRGVAENVDDDDHESHYDLGVAFHEMGLVDEAISEFQKALRGPGQRVRTSEALGQCFVDKGQHQVATSVLGRAAAESPADDHILVGVLYLLGVTHEALGRGDEAIAFYQRVFAVDINFRDVEDRLLALERTT